MHREKFGKLVLLEQTETGVLGPEYRAAKLGPAGLDKIVTILRLAPAISGDPEVARSVMDQAKGAAQLQSPYILKIFGIGKVEQTYYISYEFFEGKSLRAILDRCRHESFPLQIDHVLLIASKVCSALEYAHARRTDGGRYFHGLLSPDAIRVSYEGDVRVKGFGFWPSRAQGILGEEASRYLALEQRNGAGEPRSDLFAIGAILFEALTGRLPTPGVDPAKEIAAAKLLAPQADDDSLPPVVADILRKSLASDPASRYADAQEMRKALDTLLFSGDFTPTTFNLAFFMHSLYREDIEQEARQIKEEREASYADFLAEERGAHGAAAALGATAAAPPKTGWSDDNVAGPEEAAPAPLLPTVEAPVAPSRTRGPGGPSASDDRLRVSGLKEPAGATPVTAAPPPSRGPLLAILLVLLAAVSGAYYFLILKPAPPLPTPLPAAGPSALSAGALAAAQARIQELEDKLKALEEEKAQAEAKAVEEAKKKVEAQAAARGQAPDPATVASAQEEARRRSKAEQDQRQRDELRRIEDQKRAEEARLAESRRRVEEPVAKPEAPASATPPPTEAPPPVATVTPGPSSAALVSLEDPGVIGPVVERQANQIYPPIALRQRIGGSVALNVLVDEKGNVLDATVVSSTNDRAGLNQAAIENVKRRHYRPATKDGVPVRVWIRVQVRFELPK